MLVVLLIGITVAFIQISVGRDPDRMAELEARRMAALLEHLRDESILTGRAHAIEINEAEGRYHFLRVGKDWETIEKDSVLRTRFLPEDVTFRMGITGKKKEGALDRIVVQNMGEFTPFVITFTGLEQNFSVSAKDGLNLIVEQNENES